MGVGSWCLPWRTWGLNSVIRFGSKCLYLLNHLARHQLVSEHFFFFLECLSCGRYCSFYFQDFTPLLQPHEKGSVSRADAQGGICSSSDLSRKWQPLCLVQVQSWALKLQTAASVYHQWPGLWTTGSDIPESCFMEFLMLSWDRVSLFSQGCPRTHSIDLTGLEFTELCLLLPTECLWVFT